GSRLRIYHIRTGLMRKNKPASVNCLTSSASMSFRKIRDRSFSPPRKILLTSGAMDNNFANRYFFRWPRPVRLAGIAIIVALGLGIYGLRLLAMEPKVISPAG